MSSQAIITITFDDGNIAELVLRTQEVREGVFAYHDSCDIEDVPHAVEHLIRRVRQEIEFPRKER